MSGIELVATERERQVSAEGWTPEHDNEHDEAQLIDAALSYALTAYGQVMDAADDGAVPHEWPWSRDWWKPSPDPIRNLVKAGALIAAEIDRLQRIKS
jgi:hypothetical protein